MAIRDGNRVAGSLQDVTRLLALPADDCNVLLVSSRTLYLLANFADNEVNWISRYYDQVFDGGMVNVIEAGDSVVADIAEIAQGYRLEVIPVNCDELSTSFMAIADAISRLADSQGGCGTCQVLQCGSGGAASSGGAPTTTIDDGITNPNPDLFPGYEEYDDFKCRLSEYMVEQMQSDVDKLLDLNWATITFYGALELAAIIAATVATPIIGDEILAVVGAVALAAGVMNGPLGELDNALSTASDSIICALYTAPNVTVAKANAKTAIFQQLESQTSGVTLFVAQQFGALFLSFASLNRLFDGDETKSYPESTFDCSTCLDNSLSWTFDASAEGWTITDNSSGGDSEAGGSWFAISLCLRTILHLDDVAFAAGIGTWRQTEFTPFAVSGARLSFDHTGPSDNINTRFTARIIYTDASIDEANDEMDEAGEYTTTLITATAKTIDHIEIEIARTKATNPGDEWDFQTLIDNVLLEW